MSLDQKLGDVIAKTVNADYIENYIGKQVTIHGKIDSINNNTAFITVQEEENKKITVNNFNENMQPGIYVKVVGTVNGDRSINSIFCKQMDESFDLSMMNEVVRLSQSKEFADYF